MWMSWTMMIRPRRSPDRADFSRQSGSEFYVRIAEARLTFITVVYDTVAFCVPDNWESGKGHERSETFQSDGFVQSLQSTSRSSSCSAPPSLRFPTQSPHRTPTRSPTPYSRMIPRMGLVTRTGWRSGRRMGMMTGLGRMSNWRARSRAPGRSSGS